MAKAPLGNPHALMDMLGYLAMTVDARASGEVEGERSYTERLLKKGPLHCGKKIAEEGAELALAIAAEGRRESAAEAADLLYHVLVGLRSKGVSLDQVAAALRARRGISGLDEKASRSK